jgi:CRP-like cAMP-binding protein
MVTELIGSIKSEKLREIGLFRPFSDAELLDIARIGEARTFEAHSNIVIEGELSWGLYVVLDGDLTVLKNNPLTGQQFEVAEIRPGGMFGEMSLLDEQPRSATVKALDDSRLFLISKEKFMSWLGSNQERSLRFYQHCTSDLVRRMRELNENFVQGQYQLWKTAIHNKERSAS